MSIDMILQINEEIIMGKVSSEEEFCLKTENHHVYVKELYNIIVEFSVLMCSTTIFLKSQYVLY